MTEVWTTPYGAGADVRPLALFPQHAIVPAVRSPQVCELPALTAVNGPVWPAAWPLVFKPQHSTAPLLRSPQLWKSPTLSAVKVPVCAALCP